MTLTSTVSIQDIKRTHPFLQECDDSQITKAYGLSQDPLMSQIAHNMKSGKWNQVCQTCKTHGHLLLMSAYIHSNETKVTLKEVVTGYIFLRTISERGPKTTVVPDRKSELPEQNLKFKIEGQLLLSTIYPWGHSSWGRFKFFEFTPVLGLSSEENILTRLENFQSVAAIIPPHQHFIVHGWIKTVDAIIHHDGAHTDIRDRLVEQCGKETYLLFLNLSRLFLNTLKTMPPLTCQIQESNAAYFLSSDATEADLCLFLIKSAVTFVNEALVDDINKYTTLNEQSVRHYLNFCLSQLRLHGKLEHYKSRLPPDFIPYDLSTLPDSLIDKCLETLEI